MEPVTKYRAFFNYDRPRVERIQVLCEDEGMSFVRTWDESVDAYEHDVVMSEVVFDSELKARARLIGWLSTQTSRLLEYLSDMSFDTREMVNRGNRS